MPVIGETKQRFSRSYIYVNPSVGSNNFTQGTWRLTIEEDPDKDPDISEFWENGIAAEAIQTSQLLYVDDSNGQLRLAKADSAATGRVAGICVIGGSPGDEVHYTRNLGVTIENLSDKVDGSPSELEPGKYYYLSATNAGNLTRTPDTTTSGSVVVQVGLALSKTQLTVEIQAPLLI